jgi:hypothetical protein
MFVATDMNATAIRAYPSIGKMLLRNNIFLPIIERRTIMAKGSVRKKERYSTTASMWRTQAAIWFKKSLRVRKERVRRKMLRQAMEDYDEKKFIAKADNITHGDLLDIWAEEELKVGTLSNGTVGNYL